MSEIDVATETLKAIGTPDLSSGGQKYPAKFPSSFLDEEDKHPNYAIKLSDKVAEKIFDGSKTLFTFDSNIENSHEQPYFMMVENTIVGVMKLGYSFEMSEKDYSYTKNTHHDEGEYQKGLHGYRIVTSRKFESPIIVVSKSEEKIIDINSCDVKGVFDTQVWKRTNEERVVAAAVLVPGVTDLHKEIYDEETVRKAGYYFMEHYRQDDEHGLDVMHDGEVVPDAIRVLQSFVLDEERTYVVDVPALDKGHPSKKQRSITLPKGTWIMYARVISDKLWGGVKKGGFTGWSIAGLASVRELRKILLAA